MIRRRGCWFKAALLLVTFAALYRWPIPECAMCEPNPFIKDVASHERRSAVFVGWFVGWSFAAGVFRWRGSLLVPVGIILADVLTQYRGGVPLWSIANNEGPFLLIFGLPVGYGIFVVGFAAGEAVRWSSRTIRRKQ